MRYLKWAIFNFAILAAFVYGREYDVYELELIAVVLFWYTSIMAFLVYIFKEKIIYAVIIKDRVDRIIKIPSWLDQSYDFIVVAVMLSYGYYFLTFAYLMHTFFLYDFKKTLMKDGLQIFIKQTEEILNGKIDKRF